MKTLKLTVHKRYFEAIKNGTKTEEYREIKPYWISRLAKKENRNVIAGGDVINNHTGQNYTIKRFAAVEFKNGYKKDAPTLVFEIKDITIGKPQQYGAMDFMDSKEQEETFIIKLGRELSRSNC